MWVNVWFEIEERRLKAVLTRNPETGEPEREIHKHVPVEPRPPDPHPPLHFKHRKIQAHARWNDETKTYDMEVHRLPEHYTFSNESEELLRIAFESFADDYLYLIGKGRDDQPSLHERLHSICRHLPSDFEPTASANATARIAPAAANIFSNSLTNSAMTGACAPTLPARAQGR